MAINDSDAFVLNETFQHKMRKFKLPASSQLAANAGMPTEEEDIAALRKTQLDACIVRVMKARRGMEYNELTVLTIALLAKYHTPQPKHIEKRVDDFDHARLLQEARRERQHTI